MTSVAKPAVSVLLTAHNDAPTVRAAIDSVLGQTFTDYELLILDDASTDDTWAVLQSYAAQDARARLQRNESNLGLTRSLNRLLAAARGQYIARQDADDISLPDRLARQVATLEAQPDAVLVSANYTEIDADGAMLRTVHRDEPPAVVAWRLLFHNALTPHSLVMLRRDAVEHAGGYNETYRTAQDYALWLRLMDQGALVILPDVLLHLRQRPDSISNMQRSDQFANTVRASRKKLGDLTGVKFSVAEVEDLFGFWAGWRGPNLDQWRDLDRCLWAIYRAFNARYRPDATERRQIRRTTALQYAAWLAQESDPLAELRLCLVAAAWHPQPALAHSRAYGWRWLSRVWYRARRRMTAGRG